MTNHQRTAAKPRSIAAPPDPWSGDPFIKLPKPVFVTPACSELSARALKMLIDLFADFNGSNNGDLCAARSVMLPRGWKSDDQRNKALRELLEKRWIVVTRKGGLNMETLYAVTWLPVNECGGKLDAGTASFPIRKDWGQKNDSLNPHSGSA